MIATHKSTCTHLLKSVGALGLISLPQGRVTHTALCGARPRLPRALNRGLLTRGTCAADAAGEMPLQTQMGSDSPHQTHIFRGRGVPDCQPNSRIPHRTKKLR